MPRLDCYYAVIFYHQFLKTKLHYFWVRQIYAMEILASNFEICLASFQGGGGAALDPRNYRTCGPKFYFQNRTFAVKIWWISYLLTVHFNNEKTTLTVHEYNFFAWSAEKMSKGQIAQKNFVQSRKKSQKSQKVTYKKS